MKTLKKIFANLASPFAIGIYFTFFISISAFFYMTKVEKHGVFEIIQWMHQKSIDLRLQARGKRMGSEQIALLAIDEKAVATQGRWPWPRAEVAKALDSAYQLGAKIIALDVIFSEPSAQPTKELYDELDAKSLLSPAIRNSMLESIEKKDDDKILADFFERNKSRLVLGSFAENPIVPGNYQEICLNWIFEQSDSFKIWESEAQFIGVEDPNELYISDFIADPYKNYLLQLEQAIRESQPIPKTAYEKVSLNSQIFHEKLMFCESFLRSPNEVDPEYADPIYDLLSKGWENIKSEDEEIHFNTFEEWAENIRTKYKPSTLEFERSWTMNTRKITPKENVNTAYFNAHQDTDGTIRKNKLVQRSGNTYMPALGLKAFLLANNYSAFLELQADPKYNFEKKSIARLKILNGDTGEFLFEIPVNEKGEMLINYAGPQKMFPHISLAELLTDSDTATIEMIDFDGSTGRYSKNPIEKVVNKKEWIKDKIFILGATAIGIYDLRVTPFEENFPGPETHVNVLDNLLRQDFLQAHPMEETYMAIVLLVFGILISFALSKLGALSGFGLTTCLLVGSVFFDKYYFFSSGIVTTIIFPLLLIGSLYTIMTFYKYFTEERSKREIRGTFAKYVSPSIVDEILASPENLELGGKKLRMTVFFSDVRGFTTISEKLDPKALSDLLNYYLTPMTELVFENRGTLDKYMGDAVMAFFGAPISYPDHAAHACRCAIQSLEKLKELQLELEQKGLPHIDIGIGLNTGEMSVGNMGSETVRNYTVMGDAVNLGSRLEGINKQYGTRIIISEYTYEDVRANFVCREIDWVRVKGKVEPVKIYELIAEDHVPSEIQNLLQHFNSGFALYHQQKWEQAMEEFGQALNINPEDGPSKLYMERCEDYKAEAPPDDWDGVFVMTTK